MHALSGVDHLAAVEGLPCGAQLGFGAGCEPLEHLDEERDVVPEAERDIAAVDSGDRRKLAGANGRRIAERCRRHVPRLSTGFRQGQPHPREERLDQDGRFDRFGDVSIHAGGAARGLVVGQNRGRHGEDGHGRRSRACAQLARRLEAVEDGHVQIHQDGIERSLFDQRERLLPVAGDGGSHAQPLEQIARHQLVGVDVLHDQDVGTTQGRRAREHRRHRVGRQLERLRPAQPHERVEQTRGGDRLAEHRLKRQPGGLVEQLLPVERRDHHHHRRLAEHLFLNAIADPAHHLEPAHRRHPPVEQHQVERALQRGFGWEQQGDRFGARARLHGLDAPGGEHLDEHMARALDVIDDERTQAADRQELPREVAPGAHRQLQFEVHGAAPTGLAIDHEGAAHLRHEALGDHEPEARTAEAPRDRTVGLRERREEQLLVRRGDADAGVLDRELQTSEGGRRRRQRGHPQTDVPGLGELHGVADEVVQHLAEPQRVAHERRGQAGLDTKVELHALAFGAKREEVDDGLEQLIEVELRLLDQDPIGLQLGIVEDVVERRQQRLRGAVDALEVLSDPRRQLGQARPECGEADDRVHRRADLVAHVGEEHALGGVRCLGLDLRPFQRLLDRDLGREVVVDADDP